MENLTWLWLDRNSSKEHLEEILTKLNFKLEQFNNPSQLTNFLIEQKNKLKNFGLILDSYLPANPFIYSPKEWNGFKESLYKTIKNGYDCGLMYFEQIILNGDKTPIWTPPPPTFFLSTISLDAPFLNIKERIKQIKTKWAFHNNVKPEEAKVKYIRKWDIPFKDLYKTRDLFSFN
jgi:hypothetical protein